MAPGQLEQAVEFAKEYLLTPQSVHDAEFARLEKLPALQNEHAALVLAEEPAGHVHVSPPPEPRDKKPGLHEHEAGELAAPPAKEKERRGHEAHLRVVALK